MNWKIDISRNAEKFISKNNLTAEEVQGLVRKAILYFRGEDINIDIKKLSRPCKNYSRV